jgi:hypothetical protein
MILFIKSFEGSLGYSNIIISETVTKKSEKMLSKNLLETKSIIFSEHFEV